VNKKDILLKFHQNLFHIKEDLDKEMNWFMIESIGTINIILPHVFCLANYNDFIKEKIFIHGIIFNSNKEFITNILKDLHWWYKNNFVNISINTEKNNYLYRER